MMNTGVYAASKFLLDGVQKNELRMENGRDCYIYRNLIRIIRRKVKVNQLSGDREFT